MRQMTNKHSLKNFMLKYELIDQDPCANTLGEGVQWNHREQAVWWVDITIEHHFSLIIWASKALHISPNP